MYRFIRMMAVFMLFVFSISLTACGPSARTQALQAQYAALQQAPITPTYSYIVTKPFLLMGKLVRNSQELAQALANRPGMVIAIADSKESYMDLIIESDLSYAGYKLVGKTKRGKNIEMTFQADQSAMQAAQVQRQQQLQNLQLQINQSQQADSSATQTYTTLGITAGSIAIGVLGTVLANQ